MQHPASLSVNAFLHFLEWQKRLGNNFVFMSLVKIFCPIKSTLPQPDAVSNFGIENAKPGTLIYTAVLRLSNHPYILFAFTELPEPLERQKTIQLLRIPYILLSRMYIFFQLLRICSTKLNQSMQS